MERWQQIESLFQEALERDPAERDAWLREACQGDSDLRREVASLLANHQAAADFQPWPGQRRQNWSTDPPRSSPASAWVPIGLSASWRPAAWVKSTVPPTRDCIASRDQSFGRTLQ
jgi:hypothetical protein